MEACTAGLADLQRVATDGELPGNCAEADAWSRVEIGLVVGQLIALLESACSHDTPKIFGVQSAASHHEDNDENTLVPRGLCRRVRRRGNRWPRRASRGAG